MAKDKTTGTITISPFSDSNGTRTAPKTNKSVTVYSNGELFKTYTGPIEIISEELGIIKFILNNSLITVNVPNGIIIVAESVKN